MKDLDELVEFRANEFVQGRLPNFLISDIDVWNKYNQDLQIFPYEDYYLIGVKQERAFYSYAEGYEINYRLMCSKISVEGEPYIFCSRVPMVGTYDLFSIFLSQYGILFVIFIIAFFIQQLLINKKLWMPFYDTLRRVEKFSLESDKLPGFSHTDIREFMLLNTIMNRFITDSLNKYQQQKTFIENASHELQTPLAIFRSQLDLLLQQKDLNKRYAKIIQSLYDSSSKMARLNKNLLLLARIDNVQFKEMENLNVNEAVERLTSGLEMISPHICFELQIKHTSALIVKGNSTLLESLITNLLMNAVRYNTDRNGHIIVIITKTGLEVCNTGINVALDKQTLFTRFYRSLELKEGNGLGLSIVWEICKYHGWNVDYIYKNRMHCFTVDFFAQPLLPQLPIAK